MPEYVPLAVAALLLVVASAARPLAGRLSASRMVAAVAFACFGVAAWQFAGVYVS